jgi:hypothetical protein
MASQFAVKARRGSLSLFRITFAFALSFVALTILGGLSAAEARPVQASIVVDAATGEVLSASNADTSTYPASLTKMMTLYLLFEAMQDGRVKLTDTITFSKYSAGMAATNLNVDSGDRISVETAILALVVRSRQRCRRRDRRASRRHRGRLCPPDDQQGADAGHDADHLPQCQRPAGSQAADDGARPGDPVGRPDPRLPAVLRLFQAHQLQVSRRHLPRPQQAAEVLRRL